MPEIEGERRDVEIPQEEARPINPIQNIQIDLEGAAQRALANFRARGIVEDIMPNWRDGGVRFVERVEPEREDFEIKESMKKTNPDELVKTADGKKYKFSECLYYGSDYYHKTHKDIRIDILTGELVHFKNSILCHSAIKIEDGKVNLTEAFTKYTNKAKLIPVSSYKYGFETMMSSIDNIEGWDFKESFDSGRYVDADYKDKSIDKITHYDTYKNNFSSYDSIKTKIMTGRISPSYTITEGLRYTFGVELECSRGYLPYWLAAQKYNVLCIRDGSINGGGDNAGPEYVTGIMTGDTGFSHLQEICQELSKRTKVNNTCGVHVHIGNINFDKYFLINSYRLALFLEDELFETLPKSRRDNMYCRRLKPFKFRPALPGYDTLNVDQDYNTLFKYISYEKTANPNFDFNKKRQHPMGAKCGYNHDTPRYCWLNYVPAMFNTRGNGSYSLEIRNHSGTTNFNKIKNWTLFFMAFCAFSERYPELIQKGITMGQIFEKIFPKKAKALSAYFNDRKQLFSAEPEDLDSTDTIPKKSIKELINN